VKAKVRLDFSSANQLSELVKAKVKVVSDRSKATLNKNLHNLIAQQQRSKSVSTDQKKTVINLSNRVLSGTEKSVLERGLKNQVKLFFIVTGMKIKAQKT
jgi:hypothetical protein